MKRKNEGFNLIKMQKIPIEEFNNSDEDKPLKPLNRCTRYKSFCAKARIDMTPIVE
jgi:hypothetical protein